MKRDGEGSREGRKGATGEAEMEHAESEEGEQISEIGFNTRAKAAMDKSA